MLKKCINPGHVSKPLKPTYSQATRIACKELIFVSGQIAVDQDGRTVGIGDAEAQTRQVLENIKTILCSQGSRMEDILKLTVYVKDMNDFEKIHKVRQDYFQNSPPASTLVQVAGLVSPDLLVEIDAIAALN